MLVPGDFDGNESSGISGDELVQWLNDADCNCKAQNVIFLLDCCYAGKLGKKLVIRVKLKIAATLFAMCGGEANERLFSHQGLGHSIFTFFVLDYIKEPACWENSIFKKQWMISTICVSRYLL